MAASSRWEIPGAVTSGMEKAAMGQLRRQKLFPRSGVTRKKKKSFGARQGGTRPNRLKRIGEFPGGQRYYGGPRGRFRLSIARRTGMGGPVPPEQGFCRCLPGPPKPNPKAYRRRREKSPLWASHRPGNSVNTNLPKRNAEGGPGGAGREDGPPWITFVELPSLVFFPTAYLLAESRRMDKAAP